MKKILALFLLASQTLVCWANDGQVLRQYHQNVCWSSPSKNAAESMPLGGGDMGCNVWVEKGDLLVYVQRSGAFSEIGEYLKLGRLRISLSNNPFEGADSFTQEHNLLDGNIIITAEKAGVKTRLVLWVDIFNHSLHVKAESTQDCKMKVAYENWRLEDHVLTDGPTGFGLATVFQFKFSPYTMTKYKDVVDFKGDDVLFYHRNKAYTESPLLMAEVQGLKKFEAQIPNYNKHRTSGGVLWGEGFVKAGQGEGTYILTPYRSWAIESAAAAKDHAVCLSTHIEQTDTLEEWLADLDAKKAVDLQKQGEAQKNIAWWHAFWERSYIVVDPLQKESDKTYWQMGRNYQLFRAQLGGNLYGDYPTRFNGGNLTCDPSLVIKERAFDPDWRAWGGDVFTQQNQRLLYWPMLKSGDFDGMHPAFDLYMKGLSAAELKAKVYFGHEGAMFTEYLNSSGMDVSNSWGWDPNHPKATGQYSRTNVVPFGDPRVNSLEADGAKAFTMREVGMLSSAISFHWMGQLEHSYMIYEKRRFTGEDIMQYMPFIKSSISFFNEHYKKRQRLRNGEDYGADGKLVIYPSTGCETFKMAKDPVDVVAGLHAVLTSMLAEENAAYLTAEERAYYQEFYDRLPGLYYGEEKGDKIVLPADFYGRGAPDECPQFYPLFPFNQCSLDDEEMQVYRNTWKHGTFWKDNVVSWHQDGIFYARMGMVEEASKYNRRKLGDSDRRFPSFWGPGMDWVPDHNWGGSGMSGLQEMVLQTVGDKIHVLPCWPEGKDVIFKLHAPQNTVVEVEYLGGKVTKCKVTTEGGMKDVKFFR